LFITNYYGDIRTEQFAFFSDARDLCSLKISTSPINFRLFDLLGHVFL